MCPYLAKIWTLSVCASQFTIYTVCFTRGIIIQRLEFSQLSPKFPEKRGVVAILCSELSVTGDQWEVTIQPYGQSEKATALHDWLNSSVEWYALEAKPGNAFSRALPLSLSRKLAWRPWLTFEQQCSIHWFILLLFLTYQTGLLVCSLSKLCSL